MKDKLRVWLADFATGMQGDSYYVILPNDIYDDDINELTELVASSAVQPPNTDNPLKDFMTDPNNIAKAVEGSMDKRNAVLNTDNPLLGEIGIRPIVELECNTCGATYPDYLVHKCKRYTEVEVQALILKERLEELSHVDPVVTWYPEEDIYGAISIEQRRTDLSRQIKLIEEK